MTYRYKECRGCGNLLRFTLPSERIRLAQTCPVCHARLVDSAFTTEVDISDAASVENGKRAEAAYAFSIYNRYLKNDPVRRQQYWDRLRTEACAESGEVEPDEAKPDEAKPQKAKWNREKLFETVTIALGALYICIRCIEAGEGAGELLLGFLLFLGIAIVLAFVKELVGSAPPSQSSRSDDEFVQRTVEQIFLQDHDHTDEGRHS